MNTRTVWVILVALLASAGLIGMTVVDDRQREAEADERQAEITADVAVCLDAYGTEPGSERAIRLVASGTCP